MNILTIRNSNHIGGAELYYLKLKDAFDKSKIECDITLLTNNLDLINLLQRYNIKAIQINVFNEEIGTKQGILRFIPHLPNYLWSYLQKIRTLGRKTSIDLVLFSGSTEKLILTPFLKLMGIPVIWLEHGRVFQTTRSGIVKNLYKLMNIFTIKILVEAYDIQSDLFLNNLQKEKIIYIGSGIDTDYFKRKSNSRNYFTVGFVASVSREKGIAEFLQTIKNVRKHNKIIKFMIIGDGPEIQNVKNFVRLNNLNNTVSVLGYQENTKKYLEQLCVLLSPIHHPGGISLSVGEAMSMGVVPIVSDIGGNRELVINNKSGFVINEKFSNKAGLLIEKLYENKKLLNQMSNEARKQVINNFSSIKWANTVYKVFNEVKNK